MDWWSVTTSSDLRLQELWANLERDGRAALIVYLTAGFPDHQQSIGAVRAAARHADILEIGVPFSDPVADGSVIQHSSSVALEHGATLARTLELIETAAVGVPVILFTYLNPVLRFGLDRMLAEARRLGIAGILLTDLPAGADPAIETAVTDAGLDLIRMVAPTTQGDRMEKAVADAQGFIYLVARMGVTGVRGDLDSGLADSIARVRSATSVPIAVGFGISNASQAATVAAMADGVVVGSAAVTALERGGVAELETFLDQLRGGLTRR